MNMIYLDIPRIYTAIAEWCACMVFLLVLKKRFKGFKLYRICAIALVLQIILLYTTGDLPLVFWIPSMLAAVALMYFFLIISCKVSAMLAGYCCAYAFLLAEFAASLEWQLHYYIELSITNLSMWMQILLLVVVYIIIFGIGWYLELKLFRENYIIKITGRELWSAIAIAAIAFAFSNLSFIYKNTPFSAQFTEDIFNIRTLVDLGGIAVLYAFQSRIRELSAENELTSMDAVLKGQYDQYLNYQESIDVINMKYHDLKHQIAGLRLENDAEKRKQWLDAMEQEVEQYGVISNTGNNVLDTILTGKTVYCQKHNIKITCVADGTLLNFMHVTDICSIFGNALDNAIESVIVIPNIEKRLIHISVSSQKGFIFIQFENYYESEVRFEEGVLVTTKGNKTYHGYGIKSIKRTISKYDGTTTISMDKQWFVLKILIPL